jgi:hypothetical protein
MDVNKNDDNIVCLAKKVCPECLNILGSKTINCGKCGIEYCGLWCWISNKCTHKIICAPRRCDRYRKFVDYTLQYSEIIVRDKIVLTKPIYSRMIFGNGLQWRNIISDNRCSSDHVICALCGQGSMILYEVNKPQFPKTGFSTRKLITKRCGNYACAKEIRTGDFCDCWLGQSGAGEDRVTMHLEITYYTCIRCDNERLLEGTYMTIRETVLYLFSCTRKIGVCLPLDIRKMLGNYISKIHK